MSDDLHSIDRALLRQLDWAREGTEDPVASLEYPAPSARFDISAILEAVQHTATSLTLMAKRIQELEAHTEAVAASNDELQAHNRRRTENLDEVVQQRDSLNASLEAESARYKPLENVTAQHVARATALERDLVASQAALAKIVEAVEAAFGS